METFPYCLIFYPLIAFQFILGIANWERSALDNKI